MNPAHFLCRVGAAAVLGALTHPHALAAQAETSDLQLGAPIERWDEAIPLGNGLLGGLVWGRADTLNVSLDRGDLWDLRVPAPLERDDWTFETVRELVAAGEHRRRVELFDDPYDEIPYPTKLPGGRLVIVLDSGMVAQHFALRLPTAEAAVSYGSADATGFFSAVEPVALFRLPSPSPRVTLVRPASLDALDYPPADTGRADGMVWLEQRAALGLRYAIVAATRPGGDGVVLAVTIASTADGDDPLALAKERVAAALDTGYDAMRAPHRAWWRRFWAASAVQLPDSAVQRQYDLAQYFYGAASRRGAPPIPLQGVWTADGGTLPPWKGDFHNDLNTQMTYLACDEAGLTEACESWLDFNWRLLPAYRQFAGRFFGVPGAAVPGVMALNGRALGGWGQYSLSPTMGAWVAQSFYRHWKFTGDSTFLVQRAYPFLSEIGEATLALLAPDSTGKLKLPLSTSPEFNDNAPSAWLPPNSNFDLALLRWLFGALAETAGAAGLPDEARHWNEALGRLDPLDRDPATGALTVAREFPYAESHRHFSHAMAIHPLGLLDPEGADSTTVRATLDGLARYGTDWWVGYSFSWHSAMLARAGRAEEALRQLELFSSAFVLRNGFHANGDQTGVGYSRFTYRPFTLEGNFLAMEAVHEMLLQSWDGTVRVFPAVSDRWADVSFRDLRAEGGLRVSAVRRAGCTVEVRIVAGRDARLRLRDPFPGRDARWSVPGITHDGLDLVVPLGANETLSGSAPCSGR